MPTKKVPFCEQVVGELNWRSKFLAMKASFLLRLVSFKVQIFLSMTHAHAINDQCLLHPNPTCMTMTWNIHDPHEEP